MDEIGTFLLESGLLDGCVPSLDEYPEYWYKPDQFTSRFFGRISLVCNPIHAVCLSLQLKDRHYGGVSIGYPKCVPTLPDLLLGFITKDGVWRWAADGGCVVNLHAVDVDPAYPDGIAWPVWFTFGDCDGFRREIVLQKTPLFDLTDALRQHLCADFWAVAKQEFIQTTWAPHRLAWCLDTEEYNEIFSGE